jgi:hypothetical protein
MAKRDLAEDVRVLGTVARVDGSSVVVSLLERLPGGRTEVTLARTSERVIATQ